MKKVSKKSCSSSLTLPYRCGELLTRLSLMDLHYFRSLIMFRIYSVVTPINSFTLSRYFFLGLPLPLLPANLPVFVRFSRPSALITLPRIAICRFLITANSSLLLPIASRTFALLLFSVHTLSNLL